MDVDGLGSVDSVSLQRLLLEAPENLGAFGESTLLMVVLSLHPFIIYLPALTPTRTVCFFQPADMSLVLPDPSPCVPAVPQCLCLCPLFWVLINPLSLDVWGRHFPCPCPSFPDDRLLNTLGDGAES